MSLRGKRFLLVMLLVPALAFSSGDRDTEPFRVSAIMPDASIFWERIWEGIQAGAEEEKLSLSLYSYPPEGKSDSQLEKVLLSKPDGILLCDNNYRDNGGALLMKAKDMGTPVVLFDTDTAGKDLRASFVGLDNFAAGRQVARETALRSSGMIVLVGADIGMASSTTKQRLTGIQEGLEALGREYVTELSGADGMGRSTAFQLILRSYPEGTAFVAFNSPNTILLAQAVELLGLGDTTLIAGFSEEEQALSYVGQGIIDILISQDTYELGRKSAEVLSSILSGEAVDDTYHIEPRVVTKDNLMHYWDRQD